MSIGNRIRVVRAIGTSITLAVAFAMLFWVGSLLDLSQALQATFLAGVGVMGLLLVTGLCVGLALSVEAGQRRRQEWEPALNLNVDQGPTPF
jgi:hypothetical protein